MADFVKKTNRASQHISRHLRREQRQAEAIERNEARAKRTAEEQLALVNTRPGDSAREKARLA